MPLSKQFRWLNRKVRLFRMFRSIFPSQEQIQELRKKYPKGTRIELLEMEDIQAPPIGTYGTVTGVDDTGSLLVRWDNGSGLNAIYGVDRVRKIREER